MVERDNVRDHRVRTIDLPFQNHAQAGLRVHRIVIRRFWKPNLILSVLVRPLHGHHRNRIRIVFIGYCRPADL